MNGFCSWVPPFPMWIGAWRFWCEKCGWVQECYCCKDQCLQASQTDHSGKFIANTSWMNMTQKVSCDIKKLTAVRLQVIINVILAFLFILISFSIYCHTNMKSFRKLNYWLLMKQLLFHCRQWSLCLAHIWSSCLPLLMGMTGVCFWWNFPYIITFF